MLIGNVAIYVGLCGDYAANYVLLQTGQPITGRAFIFSKLLRRFGVITMRLVLIKLLVELDSGYKT